MKSKQRRILIVVKTLLFILGFIVGTFAMYQIVTVFYSDIRLVTKYIIYTVSGLVLGGVLFLSARQILNIASGITRIVANKIGLVSVVDFASVTLGIVVGILIAFIADMLLQLALDIISLRIVVDIVIGILAAYISMVKLSVWLNPENEKTLDDECFKGKGYIIYISAFESEKLVSLCQKWLDGNIYVLSSTIDAINAQKDSAFSMCDNLNAVLPTVKIVEASESIKIEDYAASKKLKIIAKSKDDCVAEKTIVLAIDEL